jgi:acyl carrier protein
MLTRDEVYTRLANYLTEMFEVPAEDVRPDAKLYEDLGLDSIDAVDLLVKLQEFTSRKVSPAAFRKVRTVDDVVNQVRVLLDA